MKKQSKVFITIILILSLTSCNASISEIATTNNIDKIVATNNVVDVYEEFNIINAKEGDEYSNFVLDRLGEVKSIMSKTYTFTHKKSVTTLYYMQNDDKNLGFNISYKTIHLDNSDTNHIFEHSILSGSDKYQSNDLFFDMMNKSFLSDCNASTYNTYTNYYFSTYDEEQLLKDMDVYMCCMVKPTLLKEKNIFKREAYRLSLYDKEDDIVIDGTIFQEDEGHSTNDEVLVESAILNALYPNQYASTEAGRLVNYWQDSTYEKCIDRFNTFYNFDNAIILLYGDLDKKKAMKFLDEEYLSKYETNKTNLSLYKDEKSIATHSVLQVDMPAFTGTKEEDQTIIAYSIDISDTNDEGLITYENISKLLSDENSLLYEKLNNAGLCNSMSVKLQCFNQKPYICFYYYNANPSDRDIFMSLVNDTLNEIKEFGITNMNYESIMKNIEINNYLSRNYSLVFTNIVAPLVSNYFALYGNTDYFEKSDNIVSQMIEDKEQNILRQKIEYLYNAENTVLLSATPKAGLADKIREDREKSLKEMKQNMTDEEIDNLIKDTKEFDEWNEKHFSPDISFAIDPKNLPDVKDSVQVNKEVYEGLTIYTAPCNAYGISSHNLIFDTSCVEQKDLYYITDISILLKKMENNRYSSATWTYIKNIYLNGLNFGFDHIDEIAGDDSRPIFYIGFNCYDKDYEKSIKYLVDFINNLDFSDNSFLLSTLKASVDDFDQSDTVMNGNYDLLSKSLSYKYCDLIAGQDYYYDLKDKIKKLEKDDKLANNYQTQLSVIKDKIFRRDSFVIAHGGNEQSLEGFVVNDKNTLLEFNTNNLPKEKYIFKDVKKKRAYITNASNVANKKVISLFDDNSFSGSDLSYWMLLSNEYILPKIRYSGLAYYAGCKYSNTYKLLSIYSYMDKSVKNTYNIYNGLSKYLEETEVTEDELNMYILSAYGDLYYTMNYLNEGMKAINDEIYCIDTESLKKVANQLKNATLNDKQHAIETIKKFEADAEYVSMGNATMINKDKKEFDEIIDLRKEK